MAPQYAARRHDFGKRPREGARPPLTCPRPHAPPLPPRSLSSVPSLRIRTAARAPSSPRRPTRPATPRRVHLRACSPWLPMAGRRAALRPRWHARPPSPLPNLHLRASAAPTASPAGRPSRVRRRVARLRVRRRRLGHAGGVRWQRRERTCRGAPLRSPTDQAQRPGRAGRRRRRRRTSRAGLTGRSRCRGHLGERGADESGAMGDEGFEG